MFLYKVLAYLFKLRKNY